MSWDQKHSSIRGSSVFFMLMLITFVGVTKGTRESSQLKWKEDVQRPDIPQDNLSNKLQSTIAAEEGMAVLATSSHGNALVTEENTSTQRPEKAILSGNKGLILSLVDGEREESHLIPVLQFQEDNILSTDTYALLNTTIPDLESFTLCLWVNIYYWRVYSHIISYAIDTERDNELLLAHGINGLVFTFGDKVLLNHWNDNIAREMEWTHVCVTVSPSVQHLYINSESIFLEGISNGPLRKSNPPLAVALEGGGTFVLGQDQDKPGGGFDIYESFSGAIAELQLFPGILDQKEIQLLHHCHSIDKLPLFDLNHPDWYFKNIVNKSEVLKSLFDSQKGKFFLFLTVETRQVSKEICKNLGGSLPSLEVIQELLTSLSYYFSNSAGEFIKVEIPFDVQEEWHPKRWKIIWEAGRYIKAIPVHCSVESPFVCIIRYPKYIRMHGVPEKMEFMIDSLYKMHVDKGRNILRGIQKSFIDYREQKWCIRSTGENANEKLFCLHSESDQFPLGRRLWHHEGEDSSHELLVTSCSKSQFTCDSGSCIPLSYRCNARNDCQDESDERRCFLFPPEIQLSYFGPPSKPLYIGGAILISNIPEVNLDRNYFSTAIWINVTWKDQRLYMLNLGDEGETLIKKYYYIDRIWSPKMLLKPLQTDPTTLLTTGNARKLCEGEKQVYRIIEGKHGLLTSVYRHPCKT